MLHCISNLVTFSDPLVQPYDELGTFFDSARMQWAEALTGRDFDVVLLTNYHKAVQKVKHSSLAAGNMALALITICYQQVIDPKMIGQLFAPEKRQEDWQLLVSTLIRWISDVTVGSNDAEAPPNTFVDYVYATLDLFPVSELCGSQASLKIMHNPAAMDLSMWYFAPQSPPDLPRLQRKEPEYNDKDDGPFDDDDDFDG